MQAWPRSRVRAALAGALVAALGAGGLVAAAGAGAVAAIAVGAAVGLGAGLWWTRRWRRRRALLALPFPPGWRKILEQKVGYYRRLDAEGRARFEDDVRIFLAEQHIVAASVPGFSIDDDTRVLIAASAAMLGHGLPDWEWPRVRDIVVHPSAFDEDYGAGGDVAGMVHHQGPIVFSERDLHHGFRRGRDGFNPGLHEMAHVMDLADGYADGVPGGWYAGAPWMELMHDRLRRIRRGDRSVPLRPYAGLNEAELFAVAVEAFFERPQRLAEGDPELYAALVSVFRQDPAARAAPGSPP